MASGGRGLVDPEDDGSDENEDGQQTRGGSGGNGGSPRKFEIFAELYDAASPTTDVDKALVASYWVQFMKGKSSFGSRELNRELKDLGHAVSAINKAMSRSMKKKPALILQVSRGGGSPQAQKKCKVSEAGKKWVEARL